MKNQCECSDPSCTVHESIRKCNNKRTILLMRIDMKYNRPTATRNGFAPIPKNMKIDLIPIIINK